MAIAKTRIAEHCYKQSRKEEIHRSTLSTSSSSVFPYAVLLLPSQSIYECWYCLPRDYLLYTQALMAG
jgi:hypothetical protein